MKKKQEHITAFYLETLLMIVVFISIILVLTRVFGYARAQSARARALTRAVTRAQNVAEAVSASRSPGDLCRILQESGDADLSEVRGDGDEVQALYADGMVLAARWTPQEEDQAMVDVSVTARQGGQGGQAAPPASGSQSGQRDMEAAGTAIYSLETAVYVGE